MNKSFKYFKEQKKKKVVYNLTQEQIEQIKRSASEKAVEQSLTLLLALPVKVLKEHYGFSQKKLENFCEFISEEYDQVQLDRLTLDQCKDLLYEKVGVRFEMKNRM